MKQLRRWLASTAAILPILGLASCSQEELVGSTDGQEITTTIAVTAPEAMGSRTVSSVFGGTDDYLEYGATSGTPSIGNLKLDEHPLSFTVGIYRASTDASNNTTYTLIERQEKTSVANTEAYFNFRLVKGQTYRLVAYADFATTGKADLENIAVTYDLNDELDDAFFVSEDFTADDHVAAVLKRPYGKLRLVAHDFTNFAKDPNFKIKKVEVTYNKQPLCGVTTINALTGDFDVTNSTVAADGNKLFGAKPVCYTQEFDPTTGLPLIGADGKEGQTGVFTMYLPANFGTEDTSGKYTATNGAKIPQSWMYPFDVKVTYADETGTDKTLERSYAFDIPVKRNWLTTVDVNDFWTANTNIKVTVDPAFDGEITVKPEEILVNTEAELQAAVKKICSETFTGTIKLGADINVESENIFISIAPDANSSRNHDVHLTLDLNNHLLKHLNQNSQSFIYVDGESGTNECVLTIEDSSKEGKGTIEGYYSSSDGSELVIWAMWGGKVIINAGRIITSGDTHLIYSYDLPGPISDAGWSASEITINGGWFENKEGLTPTTPGTAGEIYADYLINIYNNSNIGKMRLNGGTFVDYNPLAGDNVSHNTVNEYINGAWVTKEWKWVDDNHRVISAPYSNGHTIYTVVSNTDPDYY